MFILKKYFNKFYWISLGSIILIFSMFYGVYYIETLPKKNIDKLANYITNHLTDEELVAQLLFVFLPDSNKYKTASDIILGFNPGGVFVQKNSFETFSNGTQNIEELKNRIHIINNSFINQNKIPPFWGTDQEYGKVQRFYTNIEMFPSAMTIGQAIANSTNYNLARDVAFYACNDLKKIGFTWLFSPVADINYNPKNPVIGSRSFGNNAQLVTQVILSFSEGLHLAGCADTLKHFPGHGSSYTDSHLEIPNIDKDIHTLEKEDLLPFKMLAQKNIANSIMVGHLLFPKVDTKIATFSEQWVTKKLKKEWGYNGLIITDDIGMKAASPKFTKEYITNAAILSLQAGVDIVLMSEGSHVFLKDVYNEVLFKLKNKKMDKNIIWKSVKKVIKLKLELGILNKENLPLLLNNPKHSKQLKDIFVTSLIKYEAKKENVKKEFEKNILKAHEINQTISKNAISLIYGDELSCTYNSFIDAKIYSDTNDISSNSINQLQSYNSNQSQIIVSTNKNINTHIINKYLAQTNRKNTLIYSVQEGNTLFENLKKGDCLIASFSNSKLSKEAIKKVFINKEIVKKTILSF